MHVTFDLFGNMVLPVLLCSVRYGGIRVWLKSIHFRLKFHWNSGITWFPLLKEAVCWALYIVELRRWLPYCICLCAILGKPRPVSCSTIFYWNVFISFTWAWQHAAFLAMLFQMIFIKNIFDCILERQSFSFVKCLRHYVKDNKCIYKLYMSMTTCSLLGHAVPNDFYQKHFWLHFREKSFSFVKCLRHYVKNNKCLFLYKILLLW